MSQRVPAEVTPETLERIELAFPALVGGFEVHERELSFDGKPIADLLASSQGRVLLVSVVDGADDDTVLRALDCLAFARSQPEILAESIPGLAPEAVRARVVLVATSGFSARQLDRLEALRGESLWLLRKRELRSKRGSHTRLEPLDVGNGLAPRRSIDLPEWAVRDPQRAFLAQVAPDRLELAMDLLERVRLIDPALEWQQQAGVLGVRLGGRELCALAWIDGHLELRLGPDRAPLAIRDGSGVERGVDQVLGAFLAQLEGGPPAGARPGPAPAAPAREPGPVRRPPSQEEPALEELSETVFDGDEGLAQVDLVPMVSGPLLTAEELQAFLE
jgi:hypothetical protein